MYKSLQSEDEEPCLPRWLIDGNERAGTELFARLDLSSYAVHLLQGQDSN